MTLTKYPLLALLALWLIPLFLPAQPRSFNPLTRLSGEWNVYEQEGLRNRLSEKSQSKIVFSPIDNGNGLLVTIVRYLDDRIDTRQGCWFFHKGTGQVFGQNGAQRLQGTLDDFGNLQMKVFNIGQEQPYQDFSFTWISDDLIRWEGNRLQETDKEKHYTRVLRRNF